MQWVFEKIRVIGILGVTIIDCARFFGESIVIFGFGVKWRIGISFVLFIKSHV
jgi:hypothetical protein